MTCIMCNMMAAAASSAEH